MRHINALTPILWLKNETKFTWRAEQQEAFEKIKVYLSSPSVLKAPRRGVPFRLYLAAEDKVIGAILTQETERKEYIIIYLRRRLIDAETKYTFIEKLCLSLYYACTELRHYLLSSTCIVVCQTDVIKHMLQKPILSGRIGKWAYALVEYDLACEPLKSRRGQIVADFIVEHRINDKHDLEVGYITYTPWKLYFDGSVCDDGQGIGAVLISPKGAVFEFSNRLEEECTNNQVEYEALLFGLEFLQSMGLEFLQSRGVKHAEAFGDSLLVVQQVSKVCQYYNGSLNAYLDKWLDIISSFDEFIIKHIPREENEKENNLAQQASSHNVMKKICQHSQADTNESRVFGSGRTGSTGQ